MATSKTLAPTNVTISIPAMTDQPNASVLANCADKEADAINALNSHMTTLTSPDLNDMKESGLYYVSGASNSPGGSSSNWWGYVCVIANSNKTEVKQIFYNNSSDEEYTRYYRNNAWSDWNNKFNLVSSGSLHDLAGKNGVYWLTSAVTDKPESGAGMFIIQSYNATYCTGLFVAADNKNAYIVTLSGTTWTTKQLASVS